MLRIELKHVNKLEKVFEQTPKQAKIVLWRAINRAATAGRTRASVKVRQIYILPSNKIKASIKIRKASVSRLRAELRASGPVTPLMNFRVNPSFPDIALVKAAVKKGGMKPIHDAFVTRANGTVNVFTREGDSRYPIKVLRGPSVAQMLGNEDVLEDVTERTKEILDKRLEHELERLLRG